MLKVSAVPPRRSAVFTVFGGATAINDGITAEPRRSWRCHCGLCRTSTAVAPCLRCDGGSTAGARRNMLKVSAVPPRSSAVLTVFRGATAINDGTTRNYGDHGGATAVYVVQAPQWHRAFGVTGALGGVCENAAHVSQVISPHTVRNCVADKKHMRIIDPLTWQVFIDYDILA